MNETKDGVRLRVPKKGEIAPNFKLPSINGSMIELASCSKPVALVFLRHLA